MSRITVDQCFELLAQDRTGRITREMLQEFMQNPCGQGFVGMGAGDYPVDINFAESIEQMVARGNFNGSCLEIN